VLGPAADTGAAFFLLERLKAVKTSCLGQDLREGYGQ
jgi:hypothetical protein